MTVIVKTLQVALATAKAELHTTMDQAKEWETAVIEKVKQLENDIRILEMRNEEATRQKETAKRACREAKANLRKIREAIATDTAELQSTFDAAANTMGNTTDQITQEKDISDSGGGSAICLPLDTRRSVVRACIELAGDRAIDRQHIVFEVNAGPIEAAADKTR